MTYKIAKTSQDADPYFGAVSLLLDGTDLQDKSLNTKTVTAVGDAQVSTAQSKWNGSSLAFDGTGDALSIPANSAWNMLNTDITFEAWVKLNSPSASNSIFSVGGSTGYYQLIIGNGVVNLNSTSDGFQNYYQFQASQTLDTNWHHVALTKSGSVYKLFYDGADLSATGSVTTVLQNNDLYIGANFLLNGSVDGYIQDFRITTGVARYTANFTPPTQPFIQV